MSFKVVAKDIRQDFINDDYIVYVNGENCDVRQCRVSAMPFNRWWPGHQRQLDQTELASFIHFYSNEEVCLKVHCKRGFKTATVRPVAKKIDVERKEQELSFVLREPGSYVLELDDEHFALHIFFDVPKEYPDKSEATYYFGPGVHFPTAITLKSNESIYVDPEATVYAAVFSQNAENIRIYGGGVLNAGCVERLFEDCYAAIPISNLRMVNCRNISIEDVILLDSPNWALAFFDCDTVRIDNIKIVGQWRYNSDGIDFANTSNVTLRNSFVRSFDDTIVLKQIYNHSILENITVENCVLWCNWGKTLEIGLETAGEEYRNIHFRDCYLIHNSTGAMAISNGNYADIHDVTYENIHVEYQRTSMREMLQENDNSVYENSGDIAMAALIKIENRKFADCYELAIADERDKVPGKVHDIKYKNIYVYLEPGLEMPQIIVNSLFENERFRNITIEGLYVDGKKITDLSEVRLCIANTEDIQCL